MRTIISEIITVQFDGDPPAAEDREGAHEEVRTAHWRWQGRLYLCLNTLIEIVFVALKFDRDKY